MSSSTSVERVRKVTISSKSGLHARPAAELVNLAKQFKADIFVSKNELEVNAKSIMGVLMLAAECGSELTIRAVGRDASDAVTKMVELIEGQGVQEE